jgi:hypothetical protein
MWSPEATSAANFYSFPYLASAVFEVASTPTCHLEVDEVDLITAAHEFTKMLADAAEHGDFSEILSPSRRFAVYVSLPPVPFIFTDNL